MWQLLVSKDVLIKQQEWNQSLDRKDSEPPNIKEEQDELWSEAEETPHSSQLHQRQRSESTEVELLFSTERRTLKMDPDGEKCGGSQPATDSGPSSHLQTHTDDMQQLSVIKEEIFHEHQEWNLSVDQDIKGDKEKFWICWEGQQLHQLEDADFTKFPFTVSVKSEYDEKPHSSHIYQSQIDAEPAASSSTVHRTLTAQADGEDYGGAQTARKSHPNGHLQSDSYCRSSDSSETDDSCDWQQSREISSSFNFRTNSSVSKPHRGLPASDKPFSCPECDKQFRHKNSLVTHMRIHTGQKPFGCSDCGKRFGDRSSLSKHTTIHSGEKPFGCSECGKRFGRKSHLIVHMRIHTGEKPFGCSHCEKRFGDQTSLISHVRIHTGQTPFGCSDCGKTFGQKGDLIKHLRSHTGEKRFGCSECGKHFGHKSSLITHLRIHTGQRPFGCSDCGKRFGDRSSLSKHTIIHTGEKPFSCSECSKRFGRKSHLILHMRIHTGEKPFGCSECGKRFGQKSNLITHTKTHTDIPAEIPRLV
ncbi:gastrula zinc finger protein XlCGF57.1-like [Thalassophryne amazonica]|uniref:gastrula zinc finger protein XlCGF57.1-like n=1 Tax=Thalassophryne amazonica TaxID=390379 RepID=UPI001471F123|nr:gastrula zinc finger protein XlCGF57.1-like [Thalassophryne amazonica]